MDADRSYGDPKALVRHSYNKISHAYRSDSVSRDRAYFVWLDALAPLLHPNDLSLDLGCGCGIPVAQELAQRFHVTGVDISPVQIVRARQLVPQAAFLCADMSTLQFPAGMFSAIVSFFAIIHLPIDEHRPRFDPGPPSLGNPSRGSVRLCPSHWSSASPCAP